MRRHYEFGIALSHIGLRGLICSFILLVIGGAQAAQAQNVSVTFPAGFVGTVGNDPAKAENIRNFSTHGIGQTSLRQSSVSDRFVAARSGAVSGTLGLTLNNGTTLDVPSALNWVTTRSSTVQYFGFTPNSNVATHTLTYSAARTGWTPEANGALLATASFVDQSAYGWQTAQLLQPLVIGPDALHVASYHATLGREPHLRRQDHRLGTQPPRTRKAPINSGRATSWW